MSPRPRRRLWSGALVVVALGALGCEERDVPMGPPRCEPEHEHEVDRRLKLAFKALALGEHERARSLFQAVLAEEPAHPEAQLGLRLLSGKERIEPAPDASPDASPSEGEREPHRVRAIEVAGRLVELPAEEDAELLVDASRWRFEELKVMAPMRRRRDGAGNVYEYFRARHADGEPKPVEDLQGLRERVDLIVLHDTHTRTAREAIVELEGSGGSTHFIVDWDGSIYQVLDLAWEANHSQNAAVDARSIAIDLVNPVELGDQPGLPQAAEDEGLHRPLSDFVVIQGDEMQQWGYTARQMSGLVALVRALGHILPRIPMRVPGSGAVPRGMLSDVGALTGVIGHLHVARRATDPGAGFGWEAFARAIGQR